MYIGQWALLPKKNTCLKKYTCQGIHIKCALTLCDMYIRICPELTVEIKLY